MAAGPAVLVGAALLAFTSPSFALALACVGAMTTITYAFRRRKAPRKTRVFCNVGGVAFEGGGKIRARDVFGATTARTGDRVTLVLTHRGRRTPIMIDVADDESLVRICKSLGIGHHGFGWIDAAARPAAIDQLRWLLFGFTFLLAMITLFIPELGGLFALSAMISAVAALVAFAMPPPAIRIASQGVFIPTDLGPAFAPFSAIERVAFEGGALTLTVNDGKDKVTWRATVATSSWWRTMMSREELERVIGQIQAAVDRAHGKFVVKNEPHNAVERIARKPGESLRAWLARLDTIGATQTGYRDVALERTELWSLLEDPEATPDTRAAAARVLSRVAPAELKVRVANVLATERDKRVRARISASFDEDVLADEERVEARAVKS